MRLKKHIREARRQAIRIAATALLAFCALGTWAQQSLSPEETISLLQAVEPAQPQWQSVELNGKLKAKGLPVSPSVRLYMENGRRLDLSVRAPFVGEVLRLQADQDSILAINKMKNTWCSIPTADFATLCPGGLQMLQSVFLGRAALLGAGEMNEEMADMLTAYPDDEEGWLLMPLTDLQPAGARYGYVIGGEGRPLALVVEIDGADDYIQADYDWKKNGRYDIELQAALGRHFLTAEFQFDAPKWDAQPMKLISPDSKFQRLDFQDFIKKVF